jgi:trehalose 6-phosphate phosphatase
VQKVASAFPDLAIKTGKKVFEFVPDLDWDKGKAVAWILETVGLGPDSAYPIFLGDDVTDEDAFAPSTTGAAASSSGSTARARHAYFILDDVEAVGRFLDALATCPA